MNKKLGPIFCGHDASLMNKTDCDHDGTKSEQEMIEKIMKRQATLSHVPDVSGELQ
jgi:hypothetical protein